ncbi:thermostable hemolysin [Mangrovibacter yixingensis]|uniref:thermostable hemolysin n=1 Tax=Mangrovibacter yixingensis TaxID=1529639 RepID=UPI001CFBC0B4|nr:thermostable hemolysin [Mangrovibacter yixingensis]
MDSAMPWQLTWSSSRKDETQLRQFIQLAYGHEFGAQIPTFLPWLLGIYDKHGQLCAACGVQPAQSAMLFLEQYLNEPVDKQLSTLLAQPVPRNGIVEIGNFAARDGGAARIMFAGICLLLSAYGFSHIAFTGTKKIRNIFNRLRMQPVALGPALASRLAHPEANWGSYYQHQPVVMAGSLAHGMDVLRHQSMLLTLFRELPSAPWFDEKERNHVYLGA